MSKSFVDHLPQLMQDSGLSESEVLSILHRRGLPRFSSIKELRTFCKDRDYQSVRPLRIIRLRLTLSAFHLLSLSSLYTVDRRYFWLVRVNNQDPVRTYEVSASVARTLKRLHRA